MDILFLFIKQIFISILFILIFFGWGRLLFKRLKPHFYSFSNEFFFSTVFGMAVCIIFISILSVIGLAYIPFILLLLLGLLGLKDLKHKKVSWLILLFLLLLPAFLLTLYPPTLWDDIEYHLPIAQSILKYNQLKFDIYLRFPVFPINGEMLFTMGLLAGPITAQLMSWISLFVLSVGCFSELERNHSRFESFLSSSLLLSNTILILYGTISYIDVILGVFITSSIIALFNFFQKKYKFWLYTSALSLGIAIGIKYSALIFCLGLGIIFILRRQRLSLLAKYIVIVMIFGSFWYIRNIYYTGNPVWPFAGSLFGYSNIWSLSDYEGFFDSFFRESNILNKTFINFLNFPFFLSDYGLNLILWPGLLLSLVLLYKNLHIQNLFIIFIIYTIFWFSTANLARYYIPIIPIVSILSAIGYNHFFKHIKYKKIRFVLLTILILMSLYYNYNYVFNEIKNNGLPPANFEETENYLSEKLPAYKATKIASELEGNTYSLFNENLYFYGKGKVIGDWIGRACYLKILGSYYETDPDLLYSNLKELNVSYFLVNKNGIKEQILNYDIAMENIAKIGSNYHFFKIYEDANAILYKLQ
jgi:hypothetical protein